MDTTRSLSAQPCDCQLLPCVPFAAEDRALVDEMASEARKISSGGALLGPNDAETTLVRAATARLCLAALAERCGTLGGLGASCPETALVRADAGGCAPGHPAMHGATRAVGRFPAVHPHGAKCTCLVLTANAHQTIKLLGLCHQIIKLLACATKSSSCWACATKSSSCWACASPLPTGHHVHADRGRHCACQAGGVRPPAVVPSGGQAQGVLRCAVLRCWQLLCW